MCGNTKLNAQLIVSKKTPSTEKDNSSLNISDNKSDIFKR